MSKTFKLIEPSGAALFPSPFGLRGLGSPVFECVRLLSGCVDVESKVSRPYTKLRFCNFRQSARRVGPNTLPEIVSTVFDGELVVPDAERFISGLQADNRKFWEELRDEICVCLVAQKLGRHSESFLYLYRMLELVSVAMPLMYVTNISDFRMALSFIKSLARNDRDKDLAVLKYFLDDIAKKNSTLAQLSIDFGFGGFNPQFDHELFRQLQAYVFVDKDIVYSPLPDGGPITSGVSVGFKSVSSFIVSCRNRLFHNATSNDNFKLDALGGAEHLCSILTGPGLYWFGIVFCELLKAQAQRYV